MFVISTITNQTSLFHYSRQDLSAIPVFGGNVSLHYENILRISLIKPTYCKTSRTRKAPLPSPSLRPRFLTTLKLFCTAQSSSKTKITTYNLKYTPPGFQSITSSPIYLHNFPKLITLKWRQLKRRT